ncbi:MAG: nitrate/nitrite transporter [Coriobacteriia bacterium]
MEDVVRIENVRAKASSYAWVILAVVWLAGFTAPANMAKVITLAPVIMGVFGISTSAIGWVIALFYVLGFVLAFPAASLTNRFGVKVTIVVSIACGALGSLLGVISGSLAIFMISRVLEGAGMGMLGVAGPAAISPWFPAEKRGRAMGIWAMWVAVAMIVCPIFYAWLYKVASWQSVWWFTLVFDVVILVLFLFMYRKPDFSFDGDEAAGEERVRIADVLKEPAIWLLGAVFLFDELVFMSINGFLTTYLTSPNVGATLGTAALISSCMAISGSVFAPVSGIVSDKLKTRKWVLVAGLVAGCIYSAAVFNTHSVGVFWGLAVFAGIAGGAVPAMIWAATPELVKPVHVASAVAVAAFAQNVGMFIGASLTGNAITSLGWSHSSLFVLLPFYIIATLFALFIKKLR